MTSLLENPEKLKEVLSDINHAELAIAALEISAGLHASMVINMLIKRVVENANECKNIFKNSFIFSYSKWRLKT